MRLFYQFLSIPLFLSAFVYQIDAQSVSATYNIGSIPTSYDGFDPSCNGPSAILQITLPAGDNYEVTGIDISYDMAALNSGWMSHQRSSIYCQTTETAEPDVYEGVGDMNGVYEYERLGVDIANGSYPGGTVLTFEMRAWRTVEGTPGCNTATNQVNVLTWTITVYYGDEILNPKVGIDQAMPRTALDVDGKVTLGDDTNPPVAGTIRYNEATGDFEGFNGSTWMSFTKSESIYGDTRVVESHQITHTIDDDNASYGIGLYFTDEFGLIGAPLLDFNDSTDLGVIFHYQRDGLDWVPVDTLTSSDGEEGDAFGRTISGDGEYFLTGAQWKDLGGNNNQGQAYAFHWNGNEWVEEDIFTSSDGQAGDTFGRILSVSGDYAIISAESADVGGNSDEGKAYIFQRTGTDWNEQEILIASDGAADDLFGFDVAIDGYYALVGSPGHNTNGNQFQGKAYMFKRTGSEWDEIQILTDPEGEALDTYGFSVDIYEDYAVVGSARKDADGQDIGGAFIYHFNGTMWEFQTLLSPSDGLNGDLFGYTVDLYKNYAIISAPAKNINGNENQGRAYLFQRDGTTWKEIAKLTASDGHAFASFGLKAVIRDDFSVIGSPEFSTDPNVTPGKVYFFNR